MTKTEGSFYSYYQLGYVKRFCDLILPVTLRKVARPSHLILQLAVVVVVVEVVVVSQQPIRKNSISIITGPNV